MLGLMVEQAERYEVRSNRESWFGRYDPELINFLLSIKGDVNVQ